MKCQSCNCELELKLSGGGGTLMVDATKDFHLEIKKEIDKDFASNKDEGMF